MSKSKDGIKGKKTHNVYSSNKSHVQRFMDVSLITFLCSNIAVLVINRKNYESSLYAILIMMYAITLGLAICAFALFLVVSEMEEVETAEELKTLLTANKILRKDLKKQRKERRRANQKVTPKTVPVGGSIGITPLNTEVDSNTSVNDEVDGQSKLTAKIAPVDGIYGVALKNPESGPVDDVDERAMFVMRTHRIRKAAVGVMTAQVIMGLFTSAMTAAWSSSDKNDDCP